MTEKATDRIELGETHANIIFGNRCIRIAKEHAIYTNLVVGSFDFLFSLVRPVEYNGWQFVDYSTPRYHDVVGYEPYPIMFPALAEAAKFTRGFEKFAQIGNESVVLDLGAYSGLSSILFDRQIKGGGRVIAVEPDTITLPCLKINIDNYERITGRKIDVLHAAVWQKDGYVLLSPEGNLGSTVFRNQTEGVAVRACTLNTVAGLFNLSRVDFIKCDIEGAEIVIFNDDKFFSRFKPRILIELHELSVDGVNRLTKQECVDTLSKYDYRFKDIGKRDIQLPLLECYP